MPEVKVTTHGDGHSQEHTFHLSYDTKGERLARRIMRLAKSGAPKSSVTAPPQPKSRRRVRSKR